MSERQTNSATSRIGIIDLGSNSLRLAVFERHGGALFPLINEKVMCGLARGLSTSGRLNRDGMTLAMVNLRRFVALAHAIGVDHLAVLATAAVRDASDGQVFADEVARECRVPVTIIDGAEEARLSAAGVLAGIPEAEGIVGDLGGGSVELVRVGPGLAAEGGRIGHGITLPLGPLRLAEFGDNAKAVSEAVERSLAAAPVARGGIGQNLYLVGGASRALARLHMDHTHYPLHIVHQYTIARAEAEAFFEIIGRLSRKSLERITTISRKRLEMVPLAAVMLRKLVAVAGPQRVIFSAFGLREGYAYGLIPPAERSPDPLLAACMAIGRTESRFRAERGLVAGMDGAAFSRPVRSNAAAASSRVLARRHSLDRASRLSRRAGFRAQLENADCRDHPPRPGVCRRGAPYPLRRGSRRPGQRPDPGVAGSASRRRSAHARPRAAPRLHIVRRQDRAVVRDLARARRRRAWSSKFRRPTACLWAKRCSAASTPSPARSVRRRCCAGASRDGWPATSGPGLRP